MAFIQNTPIGRLIEFLQLCRPLLILRENNRRMFYGQVFIGIKKLHNIHQDQQKFFESIIQLVDRTQSKGTSDTK